MFGNVDECVAAAFDEGVARLARVIARAGARDGTWRERVCAALCALLQFLDEEPRWARFLILGPSEGALVAAERRERALRALARTLERETRSQAPSSDAFIPSSQLTAELIVGGVFTVVRARLCDGTSEPLIQLIPSLITFIGSPYGSADARAELDGGRLGSNAPTDVSARDGRAAPRVTYRTMRVLRAIAGSPRSSNREIADAAGLTDEGQTSKLLSRLVRRGFIENVGLGHAHGEPNAWLLTAGGARMLETARLSLQHELGAVAGQRIRGAA